MLQTFNFDKPIIVQESKGLYHWARIFNRLQRNFFQEEKTKLRREKQIEDFIKLNEFKNVFIIQDTDLFGDLEVGRADDMLSADLIVLTDQRFSRYPCPILIEKIKEMVEKCPTLYLCLNRHYINIDNSYHDFELSDEFPLAITQWLKKNLPYKILDMSLDYRDYGQSFAWAVPDRHYLIQK